MVPNINPNPRGRKQPKRGRKPIFESAIFKERFWTIERVFAWEDKFRRLLLRFERISGLHDTARRRRDPGAHPLFERYEQRPQRRAGAVRIARVGTRTWARIGSRATAMLSPGDHVNSRSGGQFGVA